MYNFTVLSIDDILFYCKCELVLSCFHNLVDILSEDIEELWSHILHFGWFYAISLHITKQY